MGPGTAVIADIEVIGMNSWSLIVRNIRKFLMLTKHSKPFLADACSALRTRVNPRTSPEMRAELKELVELVRTDEQYTAIVAQGTVKLDYRSKRSNRQRMLRIDELSRKYGIS